MSVHFGDVLPFFQDHQNVSVTTTRQLLAVLEDPLRSRTLRLQLSCLIDAGKHFVDGTYALEGDGPLAFECYQRLQSIAMAQRQLPNLHATARQVAAADGDVNAKQLIAEAVTGAQPAIKWLLHEFNVGLGETVMAFSKARFLDLITAQALDLASDKVRR